MPRTGFTPHPIVRWILYVLLFLLWLAVMLLPCFAFTLAARGELAWRRSAYESDRVWLIQERDQKGIGYQAERTIRDDSASGGPVCVRTHVRFFLWEGGSGNDNTEFCECLSASGDTSACP